MDRGDRRYAKFRQDPEDFHFQRAQGSNAVGRTLTDSPRMVGYFRKRRDPNSTRTRQYRRAPRKSLGPDDQWRCKVLIVARIKIMGLNAAVFKNVRHLEEQFGPHPFQVDRSTGEVELISDTTKIPRQAFFAADIRLGNIAQIAWLRNSLASMLDGRKSIIMGQILYSGIHSGDSIKLVEIPHLKEEIATLKKEGIPDLKQFIESLEVLVSSAETERNPIVFV
jgi:hypothetical protein